MEEENQGSRIILPKEGIWTVQDLSEYLNMDPSQLQQKLTDYGIKTMILSNRFKHRLVKLEDIAAKIGTSTHEVPHPRGDEP